MTEPVVAIWAIPKHTGLFGTMLDVLPIAVKESPSWEDVDLFAGRWCSDGTWDVRSVPLEEARQLVRRHEDIKVVGVTRGPRQDCSFTFPQIGNDHQDHAHDLVLCGTWHILRAESFLARYALNILAPETPISSEMVETWITRRVDTMVRDSVQEVLREHGDFESIRDGDVLPSRWWTARLQDWLVPDGLSVTILEVRWPSEDAAKAEAERQQAKELETLERARQSKRQAELHQKEEDAAYDRRIADIEEDRKISAMEREQMLEEIQLEHRRRLVELQMEIQKAEHQAALAGKDFELKKAQKDADIEAIREARREREELDRRYQRLEETSARVAQVCEDLPRVVAKLLGKDQRKGYEAAEYLRTVCGFGPDEIAALGYPALRQTLVRYVREKAVGDGELVRLMKNDLQSRPIPQIQVARGQTRDAGTAKVDGLPVNSPLQFDVSSQRDGYVTLLCVGTSGRTWLNVPNAYVAPLEARIGPGQTHRIPGQELLPSEELAQFDLRYVEIGPPGWEHMIVLISNKPLVRGDIACRSRPDAPFVELSSGELTEFVQALTAETPEAWTGAVLSFLVTED